MSELRCRPVAVLLLALFLGSCTTWQPSAVSPRELIEQEQEEPDEVRITLSDGNRVVIEDPEVAADSIVGEPGEGYAPSTARVALSDVIQIDVKKFSAARTGLTLLALFTIGVVSFCTDYPESC